MVQKYGFWKPFGWFVVLAMASAVVLTVSTSTASYGLPFTSETIHIRSHMYKSRLKGLNRIRAEDVEFLGRSRRAYVTLLYGDDFVLAVRVLGQSLRESETQEDLVVIIAGEIHPKHVKSLEMDGWRVKPVDAIANPGRWTFSSERLDEQPDYKAKYPERFWAVYTKLLIFNLTEYEQVVYLDADTIVSRNIDELFLCDGFCAVLRHSEKFNTGVLVLRPSQEVFMDMMESIQTTPSYTGGDQGFLNSYFSKFPRSPLFDPEDGKNLSSTPGDSSHSWKIVGNTTINFARIPTKYNADLGLYVLNSNRWPFPEEQIGVIHYTLGNCKPWNWFSVWLLRENAVKWQSIRLRLPPCSDGFISGLDLKQHVTFISGLALPFAFVTMYFVSQKCDARKECQMHMCFYNHTSQTGVPVMRAREQTQLSSRNVFFCCLQDFFELYKNTKGFLWTIVPSVLAGLGSIAFALVLVAILVPKHMIYYQGWYLADVIVSMTVPSVFSVYLKCITSSNAKIHLSARLTENCKVKSSILLLHISVFIIVNACLITLLWWTYILGIATFTGKVVSTAIVAALSLIFCCFWFVFLGFVAIGS